MSDHITIETNASPWLPSHDAELVSVFHEFTVPLVGVVKQGGVHFLFWCVIGHAGPENAWAYAHVSDETLRRLEQSDAVSFDEELRAAVAGRASVFAIASDDRGVSVSVVLDPPASFETVYIEGMKALEMKIEEANREYQALMALFPRMRPPGVAPSHAFSSRASVGT